jgi:hypothetical protein
MQAGEIKLRMRSNYARNKNNRSLASEASNPFFFLLLK